MCKAPLTLPLVYHSIDDLGIFVSLELLRS